MITRTHALINNNQLLLFNPAKGTVSALMTIPTTINDPTITIIEHMPLFIMGWRSITLERLEQCFHRVYFHIARQSAEPEHGYVVKVNSKFVGLKHNSIVEAVGIDEHIRYLVLTIDFPIDCLLDSDRYQIHIPQVGQYAGSDT